jgi:DNA-directed RNA polymerase subunit F
MKALRLHELAKRIAEQMKLKNSDVRAVLESRKTDLSKAALRQITETARTLIHEELMRIDAQHHPEGPQSTPRRSGTATPRRGR